MVNLHCKVQGRNRVIPSPKAVTPAEQPWNGIAIQNCSREKVMEGIFI